MKKTNLYSLFTIILCVASFAAYAKYFKLIPGTISGSGRAPAIIIVWEEKADNTRGTLKVSERWIQRDETIPISTERERIIYDYKYRADDTWKKDNHAWCQKGVLTKIP